MRKSAPHKPTFFPFRSSGFLMPRVFLQQASRKTLNDLGDVDESGLTGTLLNDS